MTTCGARSCRVPARVLLLAFGLARTASASPDTLRGFGPRAEALAGAGAADANDASAVFVNPAGVSRAEGALVSFGYELTTNGLRADDRPAGLPSVDTFQLGIVVPGSVRGIPVGFGLALALPDGRLSHLHQVQPTDAYFPLDDAGPRLLDLGTVVSVRPFDSLSLGGGVGFVASLNGGFNVRGTAVAADDSGAEFDSNLVHAVDADLAASRYPLFGIGYVPSAAFAASVSYRGAAEVHQKIRGLLEGELAIGALNLPIEYAFTTEAVVAYTPPEVAGAASFRPVPALALHAALAWQRFSLYPSPYTVTTSHLRTELPPGLLPPDELGTPPPPARFHDRVVPRVGAEQSFTPWPELELVVRAGYAYEHSPVPVSQHSTLFFDMNRHVIAAGGGLSLAHPLPPLEALRLNVGVTLVHGVPRSFESDGPSGVTAHRAAGDVVLVGGSLGLVFGSGSR